MKKLMLALAVLLLASGLFAQAPKKMSYQAVIRNADGELVVNKTVSMKISILKDSETGTAVYVETQKPQTNANGLVSLAVGAGTVVSGSFGTINWANGSHFIKTETDPTGGTDYSISGSSQLLSVPYALYAAESSGSNFPDNLQMGGMLYWDGSTWGQIAPGVEGSVLTMVDGVPTWVKGLNPFEFMDDRDGTIYNFVTIGNQTWMAENLRYLPSVSKPSTVSLTAPYNYVYGYNGTDVDAAKATANYNTYGVLYNWPAALNACPTGWHLPSDAEWTELTDFLGGEDVAGGKLKEEGTEHWFSSNAEATNETGFTGLPGGCLDWGGSFYGLTYYGWWWSSTQSDPEYAWERYLYWGYSNLGRDSGYKEIGFAVRCVKD